MKALCSLIEEEREVVEVMEEPTLEENITSTTVFTSLHQTDDSLSQFTVVLYPSH
jgi:hypothetical protein